MPVCTRAWKYVCEYPHLCVFVTVPLQDTDTRILSGEMQGLKLPCPIRAFLPSRSLWISELERYHWHANSVLLGARYQGACRCNICMRNGWWLWFLSVWQSAWAPSSEWQGLAVNANGREQLTEKRIIISLHYIYTACLSVSLPSSGPRCEQQSVLPALHLPVLQTANTFGVSALWDKNLRRILYQNTKFFFF